MYLGGRLPVGKRITRTVSLEDINDGMDALNHGGVIRQIIDFTK
jgi:Zn-dependent alcohol dehydrogenase